MSATVFIVEDNEWFQRLIKHTVELNPDFQTQLFGSGKELLTALTHQPCVITLDYKLPDMEGSELLPKILSISPHSQVIIISEQEDIEIAVDLMKSGAYDYISKGGDLKNRLLNTIKGAMDKIALLSKIEHLEQAVTEKFAFENTIIGQSSAIKSLFPILQKSLNNQITVSVHGETGTGKEVIAKAIHYNSIYKNEPFIAINVAAIPAELFESELFGHEKGSFTGAFSTRIGKFEEAGKGTLFLDEIAELNPVFQAKMLRVLQERQFSRVGGNELIPFEARIIVATHKNLLDEVKQDRFREDLYYRLYGLQINLPPLRERGKDILLLADFFIKQFCASNSMPSKTISNDAQIKLLGYAWPGNVRELKSVVDLAVVLSNTDQITGEDIQLTNRTVIDIDASQLTLREYNIRLVKAYLEKYNNNTKTVADLLDIGQTTIYRMLKED